MENFYLSALVDEIRPQIQKQYLNRISFAGSDLLLDFYIPDKRVLRISVEPATAYLYLGEWGREKPNEAHPFVAVLRKYLSGAILLAIDKPQIDRIVRLDFETYTIAGEKSRAALVFLMTGRSANAYLLDADDRVIAVLRLRGTLSIGDRFVMPESEIEISRLLKEPDPQTSREEILQTYFQSTNLFSPLLQREFIARSQNRSPAAAFASMVQALFEDKPQPLIYSRLPIEEIGNQPINLKTDLLLSHFPLVQAQGFNQYKFPTLSKAGAMFYGLRDRAKAIQDRFTRLKKLLADEIKKRQSLLLAVGGDREKFADPERFKRYGDLLLANLTTAKIIGTKAQLTDYFDEAQSEVEIEIGDNKNLQQAANEYFTHYQKARRALEAIEVREVTIRSGLDEVTDLLRQLDGQAESLTNILTKVENKLGLSNKAKPGSAAKPSTAKQLGRWFRTPSGYEIVVGRNDKENDTLTFRVAVSQDIWLHAADYPGSHVIIRNPSRKEVPMKVIQEAAELAAFYSQAKKQNKVAVHYTQKKFISKPPRSRPGLVRLSSFKTILVEPKNELERLEKS